MEEVEQVVVVVPVGEWCEEESGLLLLVLGRTVQYNSTLSRRDRRRPGLLLLPIVSTGGDHV